MPALAENAAPYTSYTCPQPRVDRPFPKGRPEALINRASQGRLLEPLLKLLYRREFQGKHFASRAFMFDGRSSNHLSGAVFQFMFFDALYPLCLKDLRAFYVFCLIFSGCGKAVPTGRALCARRLFTFVGHQFPTCPSIALKRFIHKDFRALPLTRTTQANLLAAQ